MVRGERCTLNQLAAIVERIGHRGYRGSRKPINRIRPSSRAIRTAVANHRQAEQGQSNRRHRTTVNQTESRCEDCRHNAERDGKPNGKDA